MADNEVTIVVRGTTHQMTELISEVIRDSEGFDGYELVSIELKPANS